MELNQKFPKSMPQEKLAMGHLYEWEVPMQELGGKEGGSFLEGSILSEAYTNRQHTLVTILDTLGKTATSYYNSQSPTNKWSRSQLTKEKEKLSNKSLFSPTSTYITVLGMY